MRFTDIASERLKSRGLGVFQFQELSRAEARHLAAESIALERDCYAGFQEPQISPDEFVDNPDSYRESFWVGESPTGPMYAYLLLENHTPDDLEIPELDELEALSESEVQLIEDSFQQAPKILYFADVCRKARREGLSAAVSAGVGVGLLEAYNHIFENSPSGSILYTEAAYRPGQQPSQAIALRSFSRWASSGQVEELFRIVAEDYYFQGDGSGAVLVAWRKV